jgi:ubiquinone/menaquinone biosynthesis C-methylase UbiE
MIGMPQENTYFLDAESAEEMARLDDQDGVFTQGMGGLLAERGNDFTGIMDALDIGCGPGGWVRDVAFTHPEVHVTGIDISERMIEYAEAQAQIRGLTNAHFLVMDATQPLVFPDESFDFINARYMLGFLTADLWPLVLRDFWRLLRPGGLLRLTESETFGSSNSSSMEQFARLLTASFKKAGHSLAPQSRHNGIVPALPPLLRQIGFEDVKMNAHVLNYSYGMPAYKSITQDWEIGYKLAFNYFLETGVAASEAELRQLHAQMLEEFQRPDFCAYHDLLSTSAQKPLV